MAFTPLEFAQTLLTRGVHGFCLFGYGFYTPPEPIISFWKLITRFQLSYIKGRRMETAGSISVFGRVNRVKNEEQKREKSHY